METALTIAVAILGTILLPIIGVLIVAWSDLQGLKKELKEIEKIATHEVRIALLEATVTELRRMPEALTRIEGLLRSKV